MRCIQVDNVNQALAEGLRILAHSGVRSESRNGPVIMLNEPVTTTYERPWARVLFSPLRDANPFFHFMEALWMLSGRNDVAWPSKFNSSFGQFSDDGETFNGAYGYRWRSYFNRDQLVDVIEELRKPDTRRAVLGMWSPEHDLGSESRDIPCNLNICFDTRDGTLNMTVFNRSNDIWWGAYGANAVHMSMLQEYVALALGLPMGWYAQVSNNFHIYPDKLGLSLDRTLLDLYDDVRSHDLYTHDTGPHGKRLQATVQPTHVDLYGGNRFSFDFALDAWLDDPSVASTKFLANVADPMLKAWQAWKEKDMPAAFASAQAIKDGAWSIACTQWLERRAAKLAEKRNMEEVK